MKKSVMANLFIALIALVVILGCNDKKKSVDVLCGEWNIVSIGTLAVPDSIDAFIGFDVVNQLIYGCTGCNQLTGTLPAEVDIETPMFAALGSTRKMCADMVIEDAMLPALARVVDFTVDGDNLYFLDADGAIVVALTKR